MYEKFKKIVDECTKKFKIQISSKTSKSDFTRLRLARAYYAIIAVRAAIIERLLISNESGIPQGNYRIIDFGVSHTTPGRIRGIS